MAARKAIHWSGLLLVIGGVSWDAWALTHALQPVGCVGNACGLPGRAMRQSSTLGTILLAAAVLLIAAGVAGLVVRARATGRFGRVGDIGLGVSAAGVATITLARLAQALVFGPDFAAMPYFVAPGALGLVVGCVLVGLAILRAGVLPRWATVLLIIAAVAMLGMNEQDTRVLLVLPFGIAWVTIGALICVPTAGYSQ